jgi:ribosomal protein S14
VTGPLKLPTSGRIAALKKPAPTAREKTVEELEAACLVALDAELVRLGLKPQEREPRTMAGHCNRCGVPMARTIHLCRVRPREA